MRKKTRRTKKGSSPKILRRFYFCEYDIVTTCQSPPSHQTIPTLHPPPPTTYMLKPSYVPTWILLCLISSYM